MKSNIILSGCGGGYDIFCTIPLFFENQDKNRILVSLSFTQESFLLELTKKKEVLQLSRNLFLVDFQKVTNLNNKYFPEYYLSKHLNHPVYLILNDTTINDINHAYKIIINKLKIKELYLVDGGCDVLLSGQESDLATPVEDMMHLKAVLDLPIHNKYVCAVGMPCDCHSLPRHELDQRLQELEDVLLEKKVWSLQNENISMYYQIVNDSRIDKSIVNCLICSALEGKRGYHVPGKLKYRIQKNNVEIDELMITFVKYHLKDVSDRNLYLNELNGDHKTDKIDSYIMRFHTSLMTQRLTTQI